MELPSIREIQLMDNRHPTHKICPNCQGGRGAVIEKVMEDGSTEVVIVPCALCLGEKIVLRDFQ